MSEVLKQRQSVKANRYNLARTIRAFNPEIHAKSDASKLHAPEEVDIEKARVVEGHSKLVSLNSALNLFQGDLH